VVVKLLGVEVIRLEGCRSVFSKCISDLPRNAIKR
jgi:hypothetical protein